MTLREQAVMDVTVAQVPSSATVVSLEKIGDLSGVEDGNWKKRCDYMLLLDTDGGGGVVVSIELKKSLNAANEEAAMEQLRRSPPVLMYLKALCDIEYMGELEANRPAFRYLVIGEKYSERLDKQPVRPARTPRTETFKKIQVGVVVGSHFAFDLLVHE